MNTFRNIGLVVASLGLSGSAIANSYQLVDLGLLPGYDGASARAVANDGTVVGTVEQFGDSQAFWWKDGIMTALPDGSRNYSEGMAISRSGNIAAGGVIGIEDYGAAGQWMAPFGSLEVYPQIPTIAYGVNEQGNMATTMSWITDSAQYLYKSDGSYAGRNFGEGALLGINNSNVVVGYMGSPANTKAIRSVIPTDPNNAAVEYLFEGGASGSKANAINDNGLIVGSKDNQAFAWRAVGDYSLLDVVNSFALGVNLNGLAVGFYNAANVGDRAMLWDTVGNQFQDLNAMLGVDNTQTILRKAYGVNDSGWIVGQMDILVSGNGDTWWESRAFLAKPGEQSVPAVPEPFTMVLGAGGLIAATLRRRRNI